MLLSKCAMHLHLGTDQGLVASNWPRKKAQGTEFEFSACIPLLNNTLALMALIIMTRNILSCI